MSENRVHSSEKPGKSREKPDGEKEAVGDGKSKAGRHFGAVAQLGERSVRNAEVEGSIPFRSTRSNFCRILDLGYPSVLEGAASEAEPLVDPGNWTIG